MTEALTPDALVTSDVSGASGQTPASPVAGAVPVTPEDVQSAVYAIADRSRKAARRMSQANRAWKDRALRAIGAALLEQQKQVLEANAKDVAAGKANGTSAALLDRLTLTPARIEGLVAALENLAGLPDPVGNVVRGQTLPNGLRLRQVNVPMGVVAAIYEARPNVTVDIAGLALKSGNAVILRGGSAAAHTNEALVRILREALDSVGLPADAVQTVDQFGREGANVLMRARGKVDVLIPRGGRDLIQTVVTNSSVPVIETGEGNVHIFIDESASEKMAVEILLNAKTQRPSVCNTVETLLVHSGASVLPAVAKALRSAGVRLHVDERIAAALGPDVETVPADDEDWATEYMDLDLAVAMVDSLDEAVKHIRTWTTGHTEAILTNNLANAEKFIAEVDSAAVIVNASTRFTDGGELGLGAEVGISTQKLHARGPMGLTELTTTKWIVQGEGQVRS
ncbi:glutamate-5-semialdehyde dehydrogenase [Arthrobacter sp. TES]|uniref:Gamma-glutamyl phosphate reductase n=1 Tax=Paenarthrobacter ureafaciens TaxID=37931 RepID=A0AAX3ECY4_PAEUR|nr:MULTISPECIES: glutamate-5-semialdehyde dehydrogenase [Paenarthrobacter]AMB40797.1 gamma-glutamyl-phosphate reductase [Arthrobacter sp. ATCC 21022]AOY71155.1 gamma-glutamyl phosphate reductase [Arthrobacter sp. ZXY-2]ERI39678.1 gamma-glutamyl phosphate reductase [Arthrobacter sp. AK-YN10]NKR10893.1 gamma-glutamyl-phosphate reductase [Arthrobacter sp. M5]NKR18487.1 gamma-glutamyl-phosphate reductase [Arthrobacter sp. M6]OEH57131.1 gamma-glutamyl-phosphate reductase [Arthrobacter sp. D2]OEH6